MEAGNRCFDQRVPEETNRRIVDHISDINLTYSDIAREYLLREGLPADRIIKTGSPMLEVISHYMPQIEASDILTRMGLEKEKYFVVSAHREENISSDKNFFGLLESLNQIAEKYNYPIIVSTHPRTKKRLEEWKSQGKSDVQSQSKGNKSQVELHPLIQWQKPMGFSDYNALQLNSFAVLSDSGTISEESSTMNFRALNIRDAHERPEAMEEASVMMVGLNPERIIQGLEQLKLQKTGVERNFRKVNDYSMPNVSEKVVRIILSYTSYVSRVVWQM
jgi:UDP-N-acetylglucosamine 2-epimerase (non-hydrolysing)